ncbi:MAG: hypothetical protein DRN18_01820 [Thermoplasmata archaeon]|nr:MAG: hypothetical protein DRN18_01820 [Thermoplasmata archaeon]
MVYTKWLGEFAGPRTALKEKIQAIEFKISVCCLQQMGQLGLFLLTFFLFILPVPDAKDINKNILLQ